MGAADPYHSIIRDRDIYGSQAVDRYTYTAVTGDLLRVGNYPWGYNQVDLDNINNSTIISGVTDTREASFTIIQDCLREQENHFFNGVHMSNTIKNRNEGAVGFRLRHENAIIKSFVVEEHAQRLLLDTSEAVPVGTEIYEGATLTAHTEGQKVVTIAHTIKDFRGYTDLVGQYYYADQISGSSLVSYPNMSDETSITPILFDNNDDKDLYLTSDTGDRRNSPMYMFMRNNRDDNYFRLNSDSDGAFFTLNLGTSVTFDAVGIMMFSDNGGGHTLDSVGILISDNGHTFTEVRAAAADTRVSYVQPSNRILHLAGGAVTARFIRVSLSGTSNSTNNYISKFAMYHFNGRGNSIELNNASDINVGDLIHFSNPQAEQKSDYRDFRNVNYKSRAQAGTDTESNSIGGVFNYYTVTAKSGNIITVNKDIATLLWEDTLVTKINRSITVKSESHIPFGFHYASNIDEQRSYEYYNVACLNLGSNSRERLYFYHYPDGGANDVKNCTFNYQEHQDTYMQSGGMVFLNNVFINGREQYLTYNRDNSDGVVQGNIIDSHDYVGIYNSIGQNLLHTGNIMLSRRYFWVQPHSGTDYINIGKTVARGNYFRGHDYYALYVGYAHSEQILDFYAYYANKINTRSAGGIYYRTYDEVSTRPYGRRTLWEFPDQYPLVVQGLHSYNATNLDNIQPYVSVGTDRHSSKPFYNHAMMDGKSYLDGPGRTKVIENHDNRNLFDFYAVHLNRIGGRMFSCTFNNFSQQAIRVQVKLNYKVDPGIAVNTRSVTHSKMVLLIFDHFGRAVPGTRVELPFQEVMTEYIYDKTATLAPGAYSVMMTCRKDGHYNMRIMTYNNMTCVVSGAQPKNIEIGHNGFHDHLLLKDPSKATAGFMTKEGTEPIINNPARTTIRFRKIRF